MAFCFEISLQNVVEALVFRILSFLQVSFPCVLIM
jgi:hypothetical protein